MFVHIVYMLNRALLSILDLTFLVARYILQITYSTTTLHYFGGCFFTKYTEQPDTLDLK